MNPSKLATQERVEHTPDKWEIHGATQIVTFGKDWAQIAIVCNPRPHFEGSYLPKPEPADLCDARFKEACANAAFIVTACNSHEALVSALRAAAERLAAIDNGCMVLHGDCGCDDCQLVTQCYAALQAAGA